MNGLHREVLQLKDANQMVSPKAILNLSQFRDLTKIGTTGQARDIDDLFEAAVYVDSFNRAHAKELKSTPVMLRGFLPGDRITERIARHLKAQSISVRPSGGFNHYVESGQLASLSGWLLAAGAPTA